MRITLNYIGKQRSRPANEMAAEYEKRLGRYCRFEMREIKNAPSAPEKGLRVILDPAGELWTSHDLARFLERSQRDVSFFIGGTDGFSGEFRCSADQLLSLSKMTLPHELARVVLAEQIYRAFTIMRGHPYPR